MLVYIVCVLCKTNIFTGNWVPLDEYYYGKKEGDPAYREEKGEYRFKVGMQAFVE